MQEESFSRDPGNDVATRNCSTEDNSRTPLDLKAQCRGDCFRGCLNVLCARMQEDDNDFHLVLVVSKRETSMSTMLHLKSER